jgi:hypothetical protein
MRNDSMSETESVDDLLARGDLLDAAERGQHRRHPLAVQPDRRDDDYPQGKFSASANGVRLIEHCQPPPGRPSARSLLPILAR